jgi:hypothetical protein
MRKTMQRHMQETCLQLEEMQACFMCQQGNHGNVKLYQEQIISSST